MKNFIVKFVAVAAVVASIAATAPQVSAGGGYYWTDISDKIAERANRPIWAMAYASPYWYLTDGQELWSGGHVWRTEGSAMADITTDVRNAGISRVDDIVSDGQTVIFLKNITAKNNSFEALRLRDSNYMNITSNLRVTFASNEGISQITGRMGTWYAITTKGRLLKLDWNNFTTSQISLPSSVQDAVNYKVQNSGSFGGYNIRLNPNTIDFGVNQLGILPISGNRWVLLRSQMPTGSITYNQNAASAGYYFDGSTFTEITELQWLAAYTEQVSSNNENLLFVGRPIYGNERPTGYKLYNTNTKSDSTLNQTNGAGKDMLTSYRPDDVEVVWDGYRWLVIEGKRMLLIESNNVFEIDGARDYFVTLASNGNGTIMFGGAVSENGQNGPTSPLTAKLIKATTSEPSTGTNTSGSFGGGMTYSSSAGPNVTTSGNPSNYTIDNGGTFVYRATASDSNGVNRVSLYVDGSLAKTCYSDTCEFSNVYYSNSLSTRNIPVYAVAMDNQGYTTQTSQETLKVQGTGTSNQQNSTQNSSSGTYYWSFFDPNQTTLQRGNTMAYNVGANDSDGLKKIELYVNGQLKRTCDLGRSYGNHVCGQTIYGTDYLSGSSLALNARILDYLDKETWVPVQTIYVTDSNSSNTTGDISTWTWLDPSGSTLARTSNTTFKVQASATQGLNLMEVYVNGNLKRTCNFSRIYGTQSCDLTIYGTDYSNGSVLSLNAKATDYNSKTAWSDNKSLTVQDNGSNSNASVGLQASPNQTTFNNGDQVTFNGSAQDADGLARIEILKNGSVAKTCYYSNSTNWETCGYTTNVYSDGSNSKTFNVAVNAFDRYGNSRGVNPIYYTVNGYTNPNSNSNTNPTTWAWSEPNENLTIATNGNATYHVGAWDQDGLKRIDMYVNGIYANTCNFGSTAYGNRECQITINGSSYKSGDQVYVNAKAVDAFDRESWSTSRTYTIQGSANNGSGQNGSTWVWSTPDMSTIYGSQSVTFNVGANDPDGIRKIEILGNGTVMKTCDMGLAYGNQQCSIAVATTYPGTTYANYYGRVTDGNNSTMISETKSYTISNPTQTTDKIGTLYAWSSRDNGYGANDTITFTAQGNDSDGIDRIELFVNANLVKTCYGSGTVSCSWIGGPYPDRNTVTYAARMVDKAGHNYITGYKTIDKK